MAEVADILDWTRSGIICSGRCAELRHSIPIAWQSSGFITKVWGEVGESTQYNVLELTSD